MEQVKQLLEILSETPQMALWGLGLYFLFVLLKLSSWIFALKTAFQFFTKRLFDYKEKSLSSRKGADIAEFFEKKSVSNVDYSLMIELLNEIRGDAHNYIHAPDIQKTIKLIRENK